MPGKQREKKPGAKVARVKLTARVTHRRDRAATGKAGRNAGFGLAPSFTNYYLKRNRRGYPAPIGTVASSEGKSSKITIAQN
jgi:hypothetical protein